MRLSRRFAFLPPVIFLVFFLVVASPLMAAAKRTQASNAPQMDWENGLRALADKVTAVSPPPATIDLTVNNLSSLSPDNVAAIDERLKSELTSRRLRFVEAAPADAYLDVTLSEGTEGYLIVAQIRRGANANEETAIFQVSKGAKNGKRAGGVALDQQLVWEQPGVILDFALPPTAVGAAPTMIVLEAGRLTFYARKQGAWQIEQAVIIPPARPWLRAARGHIDLSQGLAAGRAGLPGIECKGDFQHPDEVWCGFVSQDTQPWIQGDSTIPKAFDAGGDAAGVSLECDGHPVVLATGKEDWTHTDFIQGYEMGANGQGATTSGNPTEFGGPVTSLWWTGTEGVARAVVHNLKTGNYEAYIVTATCSQ
jgi:hypothetical protein